MFAAYVDALSNKIGHDEDGLELGHGRLALGRALVVLQLTG